MCASYANKDQARQAVWDALVESRAARFPFPPHGRIPNFAGAKQAAERLFAHPLFDHIKCIKVNPDAPQRHIRLEALTVAVAATGCGATRRTALLTNCSGAV